MINNIMFGKISDPRKRKWGFYVYHNLSGNTLINPQHDGDDWLGIQFDIEAILSHETLHKTLFKLEGSKASTALDKWCRSRKWLYQDNTGVCFFAKDMREN